MFVGGSNRIKSLHEEISILFADQPIRNYIDPTEVAAVGAALKASFFSKFSKLQRIYANLRRLVRSDNKITPKEINDFLQDNPINIDLTFAALESLKMHNQEQTTEFDNVSEFAVTFNEESSQSIQGLLSSIEALMPSAVLRKFKFEHSSQSAVSTFSDLLDALIEIQASRLEPSSPPVVLPSSSGTAKTALYWWNVNNPEVLTTRECEQLELNMWEAAEIGFYFSAAGDTVRSLSQKTADFAEEYSTHINLDSLAHNVSHLKDLLQQYSLGLDSEDTEIECLLTDLFDAQVPAIATDAKLGSLIQEYGKFV